jgi:cell division protein FtsI/penicillin-binding protein 2
MALVAAAVANGGKVLRPRLVLNIEGQDNASPAEMIPGVQVEREINVNRQHLDWVREAMYADVHEEHGTGKGADVPGMGVCGKTGTAQIHTPHGMDHVTWFVSFAPFDNPKYALAVVIETGASGSGGLMCAPKAKEIYKTIQRVEQERLKHMAESSALDSNR